MVCIGINIQLRRQAESSRLTAKDSEVDLSVQATNYLSKDLPGADEQDSYLVWFSPWKKNWTYIKRS